MQKDVTIEISLCYSIACAKAAMESLQRLRPSVDRTPAWTVNEDPAVRRRESSSATGSSIKTQTTLPVFHLEHRPAPTRQADEHHHGLWHHRPEQESARGSTSSGPRGALVTAQDRDYTQAEPRYKFICVVTQHAAPGQHAQPGQLLESWQRGPRRRTP